MPDTPPVAPAVRAHRPWILELIPPYIGDPTMTTLRLGSDLGGRGKFEGKGEREEGKEEQSILTGKIWVKFFVPPTQTLPAETL